MLPAALCCRRPGYFPREHAKDLQGLQKIKFSLDISCTDLFVRGVRIGIFRGDDTLVLSDRLEIKIGDNGIDVGKGKASGGILHSVLVVIIRAVFYNDRGRRSWNSTTRWKIVGL